MYIEYASNKVENQCNNLSEAKKLFGGNTPLAVSLLTKINAINAAENMKDIIVQPAFHFHKLTNKGNKKLEGYFAIDVKARKDAWRIILQPLDENKNPFVPCNIDEISDRVKYIEITEVSNHYE